MSETATELLVERKDGVCWLTINREARRNALSTGVLKQVLAALEDAASDDDIRAVCVTGAGEKAFCSGADLMASLSGESTPQESSLLFARMLQAFLAYDKPVVARVNGHAMGGGLGLALAADVVIAREGASFGTPEVKVGLFPMMIAPLILQNMPKKRAMQMILAGERITAQDALGLGMINQVVAADALDEAVHSYLAKLRAAAPLAQQRGKQAIREIIDASFDFDRAVEQLSDQLAFLMQTQDAAEGMSAFFEKRSPQWQGK